MGAPSTLKKKNKIEIIFAVFIFAKLDNKKINPCEVNPKRNSLISVTFHCVPKYIIYNSRIEWPVPPKKCGTLIYE